MRIATLPLPAWMRVGAATALEETGKRWYETILKGYTLIGKMGSKDGLLPAHTVGDYSVHTEPTKGAPVIENEKLNDFIRDANKAARDFRRSSELGVVGPVAKEFKDVTDAIKKLTTFVDSEGITHTVRMSAQAREDIEISLFARIQKVQKDYAKEIVKDYRDAAQKRFDADTQYLQKKLAMESELADIQAENARKVIEYQETLAGNKRDAALRRVDLEGAGDYGLTPQQEAARQIYAVGKKAEIEIQYIKEVHDVKMILFDLETEQIIHQMNLQEQFLAILGKDTAWIKAQIAGIEADRKLARGEWKIRLKRPLTPRKKTLRYAR